MNGEYVAFDVNALQNPSDPICLNNTSEDPAVMSGTLSMTYNTDQPYDIIVYEVSPSTLSGCADPLNSGDCILTDISGSSGIPSGDCDCNGNQLDECGVCGGDNTSCLDCCGVVNGDGTTCDGACGPCGAGIPSGDCDCAGNQHDDCGVCGGDNTSCLDCCGVVNGDGTTCDGACGPCGAGIPSGDCDYSWILSSGVHSCTYVYSD